MASSTATNGGSGETIRGWGVTFFVFERGIVLLAGAFFTAPV
jgi:hypothetical protein